MSTPRRDIWDDRLICNVVSLGYDFHTHTGKLYLREGDNCDMRGCVALFEGIDPNVTAINTYSGDQADMMYHKEGKEWNALK